MKKSILIIPLLITIAINILGITRNLIYLIPSGMGFSHLTLMKYVSLKLPSLFMFENVGFVETNSANSYLTDQAAAGTALATGFKTLNGFMGLDSLGHPVNNILESALIQGKSIGLVTDSGLLDPLIASFYAHTKSLSDPQNTFLKFLEKGPDVVLGKIDDEVFQGIKPKLSPDFTLIRSEDELLRMEPWRIKKLLGLYPQNGSVAISEMIDKSFEVLKRNSEGFVLVVVYKEIEESSFKNDISSLLNAFKELNSIVKKTLAFCEANEDTLLVIVSPYEVGAPCITSPFDLKNIIEDENENLQGINWVNDSIIPNMTFILSYGPGSEKFRGFHRLSNIPLLIADTMKMNLPSAFEIIN